MPLTAYSSSLRGEFDAHQLLNHLSARYGQPMVSADTIPEAWRSFLRSDLQCPCCFVRGAEIVRTAVKGSRTNRQAFFRFTTPGHKQHCDFDSPDTANKVPENLVALTESKSTITRAVRDLVCTGIDLGLLSQASIRDMREWFFTKKIGSLFEVTLDSRLLLWIDALQRNEFLARGSLPKGVPLTKEIAALKAFDWRAEAARRIIERNPQHRATMKAVFENHLAIFGDDGRRAGLLAQRFRGRAAFDPNALTDEYGKTCSLSEFISRNYEPLLAEKRDAGSASVLAFSALLLFIRKWDLSAAIHDFAQIVAELGKASQNLGNVMGLNPFHDYNAWLILRRLQELNIFVPENIDIQAERLVVEASLRQQYNAPPMST
ncbi:hypothetical protein [Burkholderia sp. PAMC 26561]|uniref:hypothetical protein n=1 Tax=Burkholderia sp. PAMC 26561 TaxID=1795043 RepID=UPI00076B0E51|nr:hypothetical protein [Burkholderia sp. PAMC 26561]AME28605.1 hypothetical protein AXG89_32960 [Burkholderia sp. PAMC 26561]